MRREAIELLKANEEMTMKEAEPPAGEFTKEIREYIQDFIYAEEHNVPMEHEPRCLEHDLIEACDRIDRLEAELETHKRCNKVCEDVDKKVIERLEEQQRQYCDTISRMDKKADEMDKNYGQMVLERDELQAELKAKDELLTQAVVYLRRQSNVGKEQMRFIKEIERALESNHEQ